MRKVFSKLLRLKDDVLIPHTKMYSRDVLEMFDGKITMVNLKRVSTVLNIFRLPHNNYSII